MSQDLINNLSTEVLFLVFDYLDVRQQITSKLVCVRWSKILNRERYLARCRMYLHPTIMACSSSWLASLKKFRALVLGCSIESDDNFQQCCQFLRKKRALKHVEDLRLSMITRPWMDFLTQNNKLHLPKLQTLCLFFPTYENLPYRGHPDRIILPRLKSVSVLNTSILQIYPLLQICSNQLETLCVSFSDQASFVSTFKSYNFTNLNSLSLGFRFTPYLIEVDLNSSYMDAFGRLEELTITCYRPDSPIGFECLIRAAKNLEKLVLNACTDTTRIIPFILSVEVFNAINNLKKLRKLTLNVELPEYTHVESLSLPELREMKLFGSMLIPVKFTPGLKSLILVCNRNRIDLEHLETLFAACNHKLEKLKLYDTQIVQAASGKICSLNNLKQLQLIRVGMETAHLQIINRSLKQLQLFEVQNCVLVDKILDDDATDVEHLVESADVIKSCLLRGKDTFDKLKVEHSRRSVISANIFHFTCLRRGEFGKAAGRTIVYENILRREEYESDSDGAAD